MLPQNNPDRIRIVFDDHRLVANAGLILPATLALHLGLPQLVDRHLDLGGAPGRANTGDKIMRKDGGLTDEEVARSLEIASATVERIRRRCVEEGIEAALGRKEQQRRRPKKLDGAAEAHLIALACGEPPQGRVSWTLRLLADRLVECEIVESIHPETVRKTLKKTNSSLG